MKYCGNGYRRDESELRVGRIVLMSIHPSNCHRLTSHIKGVDISQVIYSSLNNTGLHNERKVCKQLNSTQIAKRIYSYWYRNKGKAGVYRFNLRRGARKKQDGDDNVGVIWNTVHKLWRCVNTKHQYWSIFAWYHVVLPARVPVCPFPFLASRH